MARDPVLVEAALNEAEQKGERIAALFRIAMAGVLLAAVWLSASPGFGFAAVKFVAVAYGVLSLAGLGLTVARIHHWTLPYLFVALDCIIVTLALTMLARMQDMGMASSVQLPVFSIAFVVLIHAALRYRPWLVAFGTCLFITLFALATLYQASNPPTMTMHMQGARGPAMMSGGANSSHFIPLLLVGFAGALLFYIVRRTRNLASAAARDGKRVAQLARFFSPAIASQLSSEDFSQATYGGRQPVAVLFIDVRGFTHLAEQLSSEQLIEFLVSFRREICRIVFAHGGTVDKFVGDAILAVFGTPRTRDDDAERAVQAATAVGKGVRSWVDRRSAAGEPAALVGVGAHYGEVFAGVIESGDILEHTVIGDTVNVAQRLERLTRDLKSNLALSEDLLTAAGVDPDVLGLQRKAGVDLAGHEGAITVFHDITDSTAT